MNWWQKLKNNSLAQFGAIVLLVFYVVVIAADFVAPYDPYDAQPNGSLLPPTQIYWQTPEGRFIGPHVYPTIQGAVSLETGDRQVTVDFSQPSPLRLWVPGPEYQWMQIRVPLPTQFSLSAPKFEEVTLFNGISGDRHLFGTVGAGKFNLLGTDEQARDQFSRLVHGGRISLSIGLIGIVISFPLGMIVGGIS
ncbi:MAG: ABC transporter permease, partial [Cyanothece sp. SIO1E1]|nr:ABC transporter permease [Cyanothece sp. SIO1E1]